MKGLRLSNTLFLTTYSSPSVFTLWPEWRDYDPIMNDLPSEVTHVAFLPCDLNEGITTPLDSYLKPFSARSFYLVTWMKGLRLIFLRGVLVYSLKMFLPCDLNEGITTRLPSESLAQTWWLVFTLWPEWRDYDLPDHSTKYATACRCFYLVTWMKGLRPTGDNELFAHNTGFLPCDLNEGITTIVLTMGMPLTSPSFYLVTWMKGLRPVREAAASRTSFTVFLPCDLNEGITTIACRRVDRVDSLVFTLWPEWRDYDLHKLRCLFCSISVIFTLWPEWR